jgi:hypothetical protein
MYVALLLQYIKKKFRYFQHCMGAKRENKARSGWTYCTEKMYIVGEPDSIATFLAQVCIPSMVSGKRGCM